ncbi:MAG: Effector protein [Gemmataceae bacterium]|nr:Effector protein [Gemmataceae bacterium]
MPAQLWDENHPGIYVENSAPFFSQTCAALNSIRTKDVGKNLLKLISHNCRYYTEAGTGQTGETDRYVVIIPTVGDAGNTENTRHVARELATIHPSDLVQIVVGKGSGSSVSFHSTRTTIGTPPNQLVRPPFIGLAHELIHSLHALTGDLLKPYDSDWSSTGGAAHEEARTVGLGMYSSEFFCENAIRAEHGLTRRTNYGGLDMSHLVPLVTRSRSSAVSSPSPGRARSNALIGGHRRV